LFENHKGGVPMAKCGAAKKTGKKAAPKKEKKTKK
jgi:hypothetical protein